MQAKADVAGRVPAHPGKRKRDLARVGGTCRPRARGDLVPDDAVDQIGVGDLVEAARPGELAVAQHGDLVAERAHLLEPVADEQHSVPLRAQAANGGEEQLRLVARQRGGRLVEDQHRRRVGRQHRQSAGNRDDRPIALAQLADRAVDVVVDVEGRERLARAGALAAPAQSPQSHAVLTAPADDREVVDDRQRVDQPEVLVDEADRGALDRVVMAGGRDRLTADLQLGAVVGDVVAGEDLDQRRLPRPVLAEQHVDLARSDRQVDVPQRAGDAE